LGYLVDVVVAIRALVVGVATVHHAEAHVNQLLDHRQAVSVVDEVLVVAPAIIFPRLIFEK
jgi:hypothetical protein